MRCLDTFKIPDPRRNKRGYADNQKFINAPCGCCYCLQDKQAKRMGNVRINDACKMHEYNSFLTITYDTKYITEILDKETGDIMTTINPKDWTRFIKSLHKHCKRNG
jgi:hypothetical protein